MNKEQIMINGVDVSKCFHYINNKEYSCELSHAPFHYRHCEENTNCYFKQLARKMQECEQKEKELLSNEKIINKLMKEVDELKQECEELKEEISKLQLNEYHYKNKLKKYKKGIHKYRNLLKYEINDLRLSRREFLKTVKRYPKFEKDNIKLALDTFNKKLELIDNPNRYRKALEEIELTIKNLEKGDILTFPDFTLQENATMIINQCNQGYRDILDIINKAKGKE